MKLELIRISYTNTPTTQLIYKIEVMLTFNLFEKIITPLKQRVYTFVGDIDNWWQEVNMQPVMNRKLTRFLNKIAMQEERRNRDAGIKQTKIRRE